MYINFYYVGKKNHPIPKYIIYQILKLQDQLMIGDSSDTLLNTNAMKSLYMF